MSVPADYLAYSAAVNVNVGPATADFPFEYATVSFPDLAPMSDLGPRPVLAFNLAIRNTLSAYLPDSRNFAFNTIITLGDSSTVTDDEGFDSTEYWNDLSPLDSPPFFVTWHKDVYYRADLHTGATLAIRFRLQADCVYHGVMSAVVLRDLQELPSPEFGGIRLATAAVFPTEAGPLEVTLDSDPAPAEALLFYACDMTTVGAAPTVTAANASGWGDLYYARGTTTEDHHAGLIGLYIPPSSPALTDTVTGVSSFTGAQHAVAWQYNSSEAPPVLVSIPARLATIVG
jgi:hypothetical protein